MPTYVTFFSYTSEAWKRMIDTPENRAVAARKLIEQVGGSMEVFYWMFGEWDGLVIYEVAEPAMASTLSAVATSSGLIERVKTNQLLGSDDVRTALDRATALQQSYVPPGGHGEWLADYDALG
jgi:uncharacterized protein with GYD domain